MTNDTTDMDYYVEETTRLGLRILDLEQAIEGLLSKTSYTDEFGTHCIYCKATSRNFVPMLNHESDCQITKAVEALAKHEDDYREEISSHE